MTASEERAARLVKSIEAKEEARRAGKAPPARVSETPTGGYIVRVAKRGCRNRCRWAWAVLRRDRTIVESGEAETEEQARAAAAEVVADLEVS